MDNNVENQEYFIEDANNQNATSFHYQSMFDFAEVGSTFASAKRVRAVRRNMEHAVGPDM